MAIMMDLDLFCPDYPEEQPLDRPVTDGGLCGILRTIACVGDSLSSGEFISRMNGEIGWHDLYDYSWGQYLARMAGSTVYNFSRGGMTAKEYYTSFAQEKGLWDKEKAAQAYIIALGVNDLFNLNHPLGSLDDICEEDPDKNADSFCGYYAGIIQRYKQIQPKARFFLMTIPRSEEGPEHAARAEAHAGLMHALAERFPYTYTLDLRRYAPTYDARFKERFYLDDHLNAAGYLLTARMVASYIDYIIRHHPEDFRQIGFVGTAFYNENNPW